MFFSLGSARITGETFKRQRLVVMNNDMMDGAEATACGDERNEEIIFEE